MDLQSTVSLLCIILDYTRFDGGDDDGGSIIGLMYALGKIWWPMIILVIIIFMIKSIFSQIFIEGPEKRKAEYEFNLSYPSLKEKQDYYDKRFELDKNEAERKWLEESRRHDYDITNLARYAKRISRDVVELENTSKGHKLLREYWTFDGQWRQGYWDGDYDYNDRLWESRTICDVLRTEMGDIHPPKPPLKVDKESIRLTLSSTNKLSRLPVMDRVKAVNVASSFSWNENEISSFKRTLYESEMSRLLNIKDENDGLPF